MDEVGYGVTRYRKVYCHNIIMIKITTITFITTVLLTVAASTPISTYIYTILLLLPTITTVHGRHTFVPWRKVSSLWREESMKAAATRLVTRRQNTSHSCRPNIHDTGPISPMENR